MVALAGLGSSLQAVGSRAPIAVHGADAGGSALVAWAVCRFAAAGLLLPPLDVFFHSDLEDCRGNRGLFLEEVGQVRLCALEVSERAQKMVVLHELAHAWDALNLDDQVRRAFVELRGLETWSSPGEPWRGRGIEQVAEVVTWGLMDEEVLVMDYPGYDREGLGAAYRFLTGTGSPFRATHG